MTDTAGREPNTRAMTALLEEAGSKFVYVNGHRGPRDKMLVEMIWKYLVEGRVTLASGIELTATSREWITALKWVFSQIDGRPPTPPAQPGGGVMTMEWVDPPIPEWEMDEDDDDADDAIDSAVDQMDESDALLDSAAAQSQGEAAPAVETVGFGEQSERAKSPSPTPDFEAERPPRREYSRPLPPRESEKSPPSRPPVVSRQHDGRIVLIDRDEYEQKRRQGFRDGTRFTIGGPPGGSG